MNRHCSEVMLLLGKSMLSTCWMFDMNIVKSFPCQWIVPIRYSCQLWQLFRLKCQKYHIESQHCSTLLVDRQPTVFPNTPDIQALNFPTKAKLHRKQLIIVKLNYLLVIHFVLSIMCELSFVGAWLHTQTQRRKKYWSNSTPRFLP